MRNHDTLKWLRKRYSDTANHKYIFRPQEIEKMNVSKQIYQDLLKHSPKKYGNSLQI